MVIVDDYSGYPVVKILFKLTAKAVIPKLDNVFAMFRIPEVVLTTDVRSMELCSKNLQIT